MIFIGTLKVGTNAFSELASRKQPISFDHIALAMNPFGLNRVQPGTLRGEKKGQNTHAFAFLLDRPVVLSDPGPHDLAIMPGSIIPDQQPGCLPLGLQASTTPLEELRGDVTHWPSGDKAQRHLGAHGITGWSLLPEHAITGQGFGVGVVLLPGLLHQVHRLILILPAVKVRQSKTAPPDLIEKANCPARMRAGIGDQTVTSRFFWRSIGSGLVIQCLARFQLTPSRLRARRTLAPVMGAATNPCSKHSFAARGKLQRPRSRPNSRGLRCNRSRSCGNASSGMLVRNRWGRQDSFSRTARPCWLKPLITLRTVWSSQPSVVAIALACSRRAEASKIWQRRSTKADGERNSAWMCCCSSSVSGRMKMGAFIPFHIGTFPTFFRPITLAGRE